MWRVSRVLSVASAMVILAAVVVSAAPEKRAQGTITAVGTDSITLDVKGQAMTFKVEPATDVIAPGAGTKAREAAKTGDRPRIGDVLKVGDHVEVRYTEADGVMTAAMIRGGVSAAPMTSEQAAKTGSQKAQGVVTAVTDSSVTIKAQDGTEMVFVADAKVSIVGRGLGTKAREAKAAGEKLRLTDGVAVGDTISVTYKVMDDKNHASEITVTKKST